MLPSGARWPSRLTPPLFFPGWANFEKKNAQNPLVFSLGTERRRSEVSHSNHRPRPTSLTESPVVARPGQAGPGRVVTALPRAATSALISGRTMLCGAQGTHYPRRDGRRRPLGGQHAACGTPERAPEPLLGPAWASRG